jgi:hypothetical protein
VQRTKAALDSLIHLVLNRRLAMRDIDWLHAAAAERPERAGVSAGRCCYRHRSAERDRCTEDDFRDQQGPSLRVNTRLGGVLLAMPWTEGGNADSDKKPGVIAVQISQCHHVVRDITRLPTLIKFIADLMTGDDRSLPGREGDAPGRERAQEIAAIDRVCMRGRGYYSHAAK